MNRCDWLRRALIVSLLISAAGGRGSAQVQPFDRDDYAAPPGTRGIVATDLNGDGWIDLALANTQPGTVSVFVNRGAAGGFTLARTVQTGGGPFDITAGDFDRDGLADLAIANADANTIDLLFTAPGPATTWNHKPLGRLQATGNPRGIAAGDVDRDGSLDLVYTAFYQDTAIVLFGAGTGAFSTRGLPAIAAGTRPQGVGIADFNHDGRTDLVVANTLSLMTLHLGNGSGGFSRQELAGHRQTNAVTVADLNNDGWADVGVVSTAENRYAVHLGSATGLKLGTTGGAGSSPRGIAAGDLNGDGRADLVVANRGDGTASIVQQRADGAFDVVDHVPAGSGARAAAVADFNRDGRLDFATGNEFAKTVSVFRNAPGLTPAAFAFSHQELSSGEVGGGGGIADFNHNGVPDVLAGRTVILDRNAATRQELALPDGSQIMGSRVLDFNRDGHPDVAVLFRQTDAYSRPVFDGFYLFAGNGAGSFTFTGGWGGFAISRRLAIGDLNRDGWDDLVIAGGSTADWRNSVLYVVLNNRQGGFTVRQTQITGSIYALALGDVNADARLDVALSTREPTSITVEIGDGAGGFSNEAETSIAHVPFSLALADFTGDGFLDFIAGDGFSVLALTGDGAGHYREVQKYQTTYILGRTGWADRVLVADLTDDGLVDILTGTGLMLPGTEGGTFGPAAEFELPYLYEAHAVDWNADGTLDLVVNAASEGVSVLLNHRTRPNQVPIASAGTDRSFPYAYQFEAEEWGLSAWGSRDDDLHALMFEWRKGGSLVGYGFHLNPGPLPPGSHTFELIVRDGRGGEARDSVTWTVTNSPEVVLYMDTVAPVGNWTIVDDPTAAGGWRAWSPNLGTPKVQAPSASPANYIELWFAPDPTLEYKLWIRGKADNNYWGNDSAWVQFSHAVDAAGNPVYRIETTSGLPFNLEECSGCGISGWGWEDDGWGAVNTPGVTLRFPHAGWQRIRIQTREDGLSIDQVVLSAEKYKTTRPGAAKNDTTILNRTHW